jgi:hypothetical protein
MIFAFGMMALALWVNKFARHARTKIFLNYDALEQNIAQRKERSFRARSIRYAIRTLRRWLLVCDNAPRQLFANAAIAASRGVHVNAPEI